MTTYILTYSGESTAETVETGSNKEEMLNKARQLGSNDEVENVRLVTAGNRTMLYTKVFGKIGKH